MKVKVKKLHPEAVIPKKGSKQAAGYDLYIPETIKVKKDRQVIPLGFALSLPEGYRADIDPRSGYSSKGMEGYLSMDDLNKNNPNRFDCDVVHGMVDSDYRGGVGVILNNRSGIEFIISAGTRIAQMVITKHEDIDFNEVDELERTERGEGGFGSTNQKER